MKEKIIIAVLAIWHLVGIIGFHSDFFYLFSILTPLNMMLSFWVLYVTSKKSEKLKAILLLTYFIGLAVEVIGINTGIPFGTYVYLEGLGPKIMDTPWVMGLNWVVVSWAAVQSASYFSTQSKLYKWAISIVIMLIIDLVMEPVAPDLRMWIFAGSGPGLMNYLGWALTSAVIQILLVREVDNHKNHTALAIILLQIIFFSSFQVWPLN
jgi:putative membrane protein|tara:strand:- start:1109 stop:1735 length:627 start_codon:yes stop_codon:yes gene_type:complete